jgi:hypothetical protein
MSKGGREREWEDCRLQTVDLGRAGFHPGRVVLAS